MENITRRNFVAGATVAGIAAAAAASHVALADEAQAVAQQMGVHTWDIKPDPITDIAETYDFDVVVVGGGIAGNSAAEAAARNGASVALLEKTDQIQFRGYDVSALNCKRKIELDGEINIDDACRLLFLWSRGTINYKLLRTWAENAAPVFDKIEEIVGQYGVYMVSALSGTAKYGWDQLEERWRIYPDAVSFVRGDGDEINGDRADGLSCNVTFGECLYESATSNGAQYFFNTRGEQLIGDAESGIKGVIASTADGKYIQFNAVKGVVIATGDISGNQEMVDAWAPICNRSDGFLYAPGGCNTGDGILMGMWAGAALGKSAAAPMVHQFTLQNFLYSFTHFVLSELAVDQNGNRYGVDLPFEPYLTNGRMQTQGDKAWSIFDGNIKEMINRQWPEGHRERWLNGLDEQMEEAIAKGDLIKADTLEELAEKIGVPAENLVNAAAKYTEYFYNGKDEQFGIPAQFLNPVDTPPFYATPLVCSTLTILQGLHVNENSQVCTYDDQPIEGLFAIGNAQGDFFGGDYPVHCPGISHGRCVVFGQLVGESLATGTPVTKIYG